MYRDLKQHYWWKRMKEDIVRHVSWGLNCQKVKYEHQKKLELREHYYGLSVVTPYTSENFAQIYIREIVLLHSVTISIHFRAQYSVHIAFLDGCSAEVRLLGTELIRDALEKVKFIRQRCRIAQSRQKSYADRNVSNMAFMEGKKMLLRVLPMKDVMMFGKKDMQSRYMYPFSGGSGVFLVFDAGRNFWCLAFISFARGVSHLQ
ncbi:uncharacterized protein [Nicotiana tomentosiformis]|uniref:uncharacterized protein n=1 Tax=Nicotiana tomentosiformis TaxID=4098 RepID=UPI00388C8F51